MNSPEDNNKERPVTTPPDPSTALILPRLDLRFGVSPTKVRKVPQKSL